MSELQPIRQAMTSALGRLGLPPIEVLATLWEEWDQVAGDPWRGVSTPVVIRDGELVVEADPPTLVRVLTYAAGGLLSRLDARFGPGVVGGVRVVAKRGPNPVS